MSKHNIQHYIGLEVGSSKVAMAIGRVSGDKLEIVSTVQVPHKAIHQGQIIDAREISTAIHKAKNELELTAGVEVTKAYASVADLSLESMHAKGVLSIKRSISNQDIEDIKQVAEDLVPLRSDRQILHHFPQFFKVGSQKYNEAPLGQRTTSLEMHSLLVVGSRKLLQTIRDCALQSQIEIIEFVAQPIASSDILLSVEEKEKGTVLVDVGSSLTYLAAYKAGKLAVCQTFPVGGANFTNDLAVGLRTPQSSAEKIKKNHGAALVDLVSDSESVEVESLKGEASRTVGARLVCEILEARAEETLGILLRKLNDEGLLTHLKGGIVLTGGGSLLPGFPELGEFTFDIPVRRGTASDILATNPLALGPAMSVVVGLLQHARKRQSFETTEFSLDTFKGTLTRIKTFFENIL